MSTRIYRVDVSLTDKEGEITEDVYLVRATTRAQAERHIASAYISASVASQDDLVSLTSQNYKVENAKEDK